MSTTCEPAAVRLDLDLFAEASLRNPFEDYRRLRDAGPIVRLETPDVYAMGRFADVQAALRANDVLISGEGVGFSDAFNLKKGPNVIRSDGELHQRMRAVVMRPLSRGSLQAARPELKAMIKARVSALLGGEWFDAMRDLASFLPMEAVAHLVGLPEAGRERMLEWAGAAFNAIGPRTSSTDLGHMQEAFAYMSTLSETNVTGWAADLFLAVNTGKLSLPEAMGAISAYVIPSLDTTILAKGHLLYNLARHPDQWRLLTERPELIGSAIQEALRHGAPIRWFSRVALQNYSVDSFTVPQGARVMLMYGCANRDERRYADPDDFDITRDNRDQLAWGTGAHMCAGMHLARMEMETLIEALIESGASLESGDPIIGTNAGLYGFTGLPMKLHS